jgi:hypothetical protein
MIIIIIQNNYNLINKYTWNTIVSAKHVHLA